MSRLIIHVEGITEETFVQVVLAPHLCKNFQYEQVCARLIGNARLKSKRGGARSWNSVRIDILNHLKEDANCLSTMMVDYYGLPQTGASAWPGSEDARREMYPNNALVVETALLEDISSEMGAGFDSRRFLPYVMMHEFEGLLFSDTTRFGNGIGRPDLIQDFQAIREQFASPEEINDSPLTSPSKRVESLVSNYEKPLMGTLAVLEIGLDVIRDECPHFRQWLEYLETWPDRMNRDS